MWISETDIVINQSNRRVYIDGGHRTPVIFDIITGTHLMRGVFESSGFIVQAVIPFVSRTSACYNPTIVCLHCRRGKPNHMRS